MKLGGGRLLSLWAKARAVGNGLAVLQGLLLRKDRTISAEAIETQCQFITLPIALNRLLAKADINPSPTLLSQNQI